MDRQGHAVGPVPLGYAAQGPHRLLETLTQARKTLREADAHMFPVRVGQHEVIHQMVEGLALDSHVQGVHLGKVRSRQPPRLVDLAEEHLLGRSVLGLPLPHPPLQRALHRGREFPGVLLLQPGQQGLGLEPRVAFQQRGELRPDGGQRIGPGPPGARCLAGAGQLFRLPIVTCRFAVHVGHHRRLFERRSLVQPVPEFLDLSIGNAPCRAHGATPCSWKLPFVVNGRSARSWCANLQWGKIIVASGER
jgi:hypothetical protein